MKTPKMIDIRTKLMAQLSESCSKRANMNWSEAMAEVLAWTFGKPIHPERMPPWRAWQKPHHPEWVDVKVVRPFCRICGLSAGDADGGTHLATTEAAGPEAEKHG